MAEEEVRVEVPQGQPIPFVFTFPTNISLDCTNFDEADNAIAHLYTVENQVFKFSMVKKAGHTTFTKIDSTHLYGQIDVDNSKIIQPGKLMMVVAITDTTGGTYPKQAGLSKPHDTRIDVIESGSIKDSL